MAWKIHRVMELTSNFDAVSLHAKQDSLSASEAKAEVRVNLWPQRVSYKVSVPLSS